jgi:hypothetical protein
VRAAVPDPDDKYEARVTVNERSRSFFGTTKDEAVKKMRAVPRKGRPSTGTWRHGSREGTHSLRKLRKPHLPCRSQPPR